MFKFFNNVGIIETTLSPDAITKLNTYIKDPYPKKNNKLAGNISKSFELKDKKDWFFNTVLNPLIKDYTEQYTVDATISNDVFWNVGTRIF